MSRIRDFWVNVVGVDKPKPRSSDGAAQEGEAPGTEGGVVLQSIKISPASPTLAGGWQRQFKARGTFSDGSSGDVTKDVVWSALPPGVVWIDNKGLATAGRDAGSAVITAKDPGNPQVADSTTATVTQDPIPTMSPKELEKAEVLGEMDEALSKRPPDKAALTKLVDAGNGDVLDLLVRDMPDPPDRATILAAIEARFNIKVKNIDASDDEDDVAEGNKSIKLIYLTMLKVPEADVRNNPSLKEIDRQPGNNYAYYDPRTQQAVFPAVRADLPNHPIGDPKELPDVEDACKPKGKDTPKYLAWNTLHEVAHGVDDHMSAMDGYGGNDFAGWEVVPVKRVAKEIASKVQCDEKFIEALLNRTDPAHIPEPRWGKDKKGDAIQWVEAILSDKKLWDNGSESKKRVIGDRVYHEAYPPGQSPRWVSYKVEARTKGITGYQFRAPGEWFAELYAAYYSGKLKDNHPYINWIKQF